MTTERPTDRAAALDQLDRRGADLAAEGRLARILAESLTNEALADRVRLLSLDLRFCTPQQRSAYLVEAARRLASSVSA